MAKEKKLVEEITIESGKGDNMQSFELSEWPFRLSMRQTVIIGEALAMIEKESGKENLFKDLDIMGLLPAFLQHAPNKVEKILRNSLPKGWNEQKKDEFMDGMTKLQGIRFAKAVIELNFLDEETNNELIALLNGDSNENENEKE